MRAVNRGGLLGDEDPTREEGPLSRASGALGFKIAVGFLDLSWACSYRGRGGNKWAAAGARFK